MTDFTRVPGSFWLPSSHAMSLYPKQKSLLRVTCGRLWATMKGDPLDYFLQTNDTLVIPEGTHLVLEAWGRDKCQKSAYFEWRIEE